MTTASLVQCARLTMFHTAMRMGLGVYRLHAIIYTKSRSLGEPTALNRDFVGLPAEFVQFRQTHIYANIMIFKMGPCAHSNASDGTAATKIGRESTQALLTCRGLYVCCACTKRTQLAGCVFAGRKSQRTNSENGAKFSSLDVLVWLLLQTAVLAVKSFAI